MDSDRHFGREIVAVVLDPLFGGRAQHQFDKEACVWILHTPENAAAVSAARQNGAKNITLFKEITGESAEDQLARVIYDVDQHEGSDSKTNPYRGVRLIVQKKDDWYPATLKNMGFFLVKDLDDGYLALKKDEFTPL